MARWTPSTGLNPEQRRAAEAVRGPVCILAGAGSGKTTTITRRIAQQVATGAFAPTQIMAVTFTDKAAGELQSAARGARRAAACAPRRSTRRRCAQLRHFAPDDGRARSCRRRRSLLRQIANALPAPFKFRPAGDLATEIEWAKNRRIAAGGYRAAAGRPRAADPARPDAPRLPRVRAAEGSGGPDRLRGPARARRAALRERRRRARRRSARSTARSPSTSTRT